MTTAGGPGCFSVYQLACGLNNAARPKVMALIEIR